MLPTLPVKLDEHDLENDELCLLWKSLIFEIMDADYQSRTHGNRRTYDAGCRGPMCGKSVREHGRRRSPDAKSAARYVWIDQIIEFWRPIAEQMIMERFEKIADELTA